MAVQKNNDNNQTDNNKLTNIDFNFRYGYDGQVIFELLQLAKKDSEMIRRVNENKENWINTVSIC